VTTATTREEDSGRVRRDDPVGAPAAGPAALFVSGRGRPGPAADPLAHPYAQTPARLYRQLDRLAVPAPEQREVRRACELAIDLYSSLHRACGKPFLCHGIGTASILADHGAGAPVLGAALLHAAYTHGRFGRQRVGETLAKRRRVADAVGSAVEALVHRYTVFDWSGSVTAACDALPQEDAAACLIRLANDLEERLDGAPGYGGKPISALEDWHPAWERLAAAVGADRLFEEYLRSLTCGDAAPDGMRGSQHTSFSVRERDGLRVPFHAHPKRRGRPRGPLRRWWRRLRKSIRPAARR
jgi:hypothetical protein